MNPHRERIDVRLRGLVAASPHAAALHVTAREGDALAGPGDGLQVVPLVPRRSLAALRRRVVEVAAGDGEGDVTRAPEALRESEGSPELDPVGCQLRRLEHHAVHDRVDPHRVAGDCGARGDQKKGGDGKRERLLHGVPP